MQTETAAAFFEEYFALCAQYARLHQVLERGARGRGAEEERTQAAALLTKVQTREKAFWQEQSAREGYRGFAAYAARYGLEQFMQRVVLYLLYHEIANTERPEMTPKLLAELFDDSGQLVQRVRLVRQLSRALSGQGVVRSSSERDRAVLRPGERMEIALDPAHAGRLLQLIDGSEPLCWPAAEVREDEEERELPERVGTLLQPAVTLDDVVLEPAVRERLLLFLDQFRDNTLDRLGVTQHIRHSRGLTLLFFGPPGTGKSMLAEAVAARLGREVLHVEVPKIMSRWVGETDKQIARAFAAAQQRNLVLLFDEADSLLTRREMLYQDHDIRFVNDMLAAIEKYPGVAVLTTNMDTLLDAAVERRVDMKIRFTAPPAELRAVIWRKTVPPSVAPADDIDYLRLAREYEYSGGYIRNAVLTAIRRMAGAQRKELTMADLIFGAEFERDGMFVRENRSPRVAGFSIPVAPTATGTAARRR
ncbi:MAG TPA: ATP-binding protein [bacterium]|nr:ATP-binding protein [bacterium]